MNKKLILSLLLATALCPSPAQTKTDIDMTGVPVRSGARSMSGKMNFKVPQTVQDGYTRYKLYGSSIFDGEENAYVYGGTPLCFFVDVKLDETTGEASFYGLGSTVTGCDKEVKGRYDAASGVITITAPIATSSYYDFDKNTVLGSSGSYTYVLNAAEPYSIGYLRMVDGLIMDVSADKSRIAPRSGYGILKTDTKTGYSFGYEDFLYNLNIFECVEGVGVGTDVSSLDFGTCYVGNTYKRKITIYNTGNEPADYVVSVSGDGYSISPEDLTGTIPVEGKKIVEVSYVASPTSGTSGKLYVQTEENDIEINMHQTLGSQIAYSQIVKSGDITFAMPAEYPFAVRKTEDGRYIAENTNSDIYETSSSLVFSVDVPKSYSGCISWKGFYSPHFSSYDRFYVYIDGTREKEYMDETEMDETINLPSGYHKIELRYQKGADIQTNPDSYGKDTAWVYDLEFSTRFVSKECDPQLSVSDLQFGRFFKGSQYIYNPETEQQHKVELSNNGSGTLIITGTTVADPFFVKIDNTTLEQYEKCDVIIGVKTDAIGDFEDDVTLHTNGGDVKVKCKAKVDPMPDFSPIVNEGTFVWDTTRDYPFVLDGKTAYNSSAGILDTEKRFSILAAVFEVPEGKRGTVSFNALLDTDDTDNNDYGLVMIDDYMTLTHGQATITPINFGPSRTIGLAPGMHRLSFTYGQGGDSKTYNTDRITVSDLSLKFEDLPEKKIALWEKSNVIDFGEIASNKTAARTIKIANLGQQSFKLTDDKSETPFEVDYPDDDMCLSLETMTLSVIFNPEDKVGSWSSDVTISTTSGDVTITCVGTSVKAAPVILEEDFENDAPGWTFFDKDDDSQCQWFVAYNDSRAYEGSGYLTSLSNVSSGVLPDNYAVSPAFTVPEEGASLEYWIKAEAGEDGIILEEYDVIIGNGEDMETYNTIYTDRLESDKYEKCVLDLDDYVGKTVNVIFRHHTDGRYRFICLDNVIVKSKKNDSIDLNRVESESVAVEYYDLQGRKICNPENGLFIRKTVFEDGYITIEKIVK